MQALRDRLKTGQVLICDGAMGTFLQAEGLAAGECPELWCLERPGVVRDIHRRYRRAGSDIVECNTFGGTRYKLRHFGLQDRVAEINRVGAALAREVAGDTQYVLGSAGPTGAFLAPYGDEREADVYEAFSEQMTALRDGGADAVIVETMTSLEEAGLAVRAARENTDLVVAVSLSFDPQVHGGYATMMGVTPEAFGAAMSGAGADVLGSNCGTGPEAMTEILSQVRRAAPGVPLLAMPNAGMPALEDGKTVFRETPEQMAAHAPALAAAGAVILGGCCGTGPEHIAAMRAAVRGGQPPRTTTSEA